MSDTKLTDYERAMLLIQMTQLEMLGIIAGQLGTSYRAEHNRATRNLAEELKKLSVEVLDAIVPIISS